MDWVGAVTHLRSTRQPGVLVTVTAVRGHAPRDAGAKMVVSQHQVWGTVGGGNLEAVAVDRARAMLAARAREPARLEMPLSQKAPYQHAVQCCGGEATLLLEPLPVVPAVAVFGMGHVGWELARILARHHLDLHLVDTRPEQLSEHRLRVLDDAPAHVHTHQVPVLPELVLAGLPPGSHVLVMTHDHGEDLALCDAALRHPRLGSVGLIGSSAKWARFRRRLTELGHDEETTARITIPVGLPGLPGKEPATIAVSVAAALLLTIQAEQCAETPRHTPTGPGTTPTGSATRAEVRP